MTGEQIKNDVLKEISGGHGRFSSVGSAKFKLGTHCVHIRFCSTNSRAPGKYKFNINPNTLSADFELWICGDHQRWYLLPINVVTTIYQNPDGYVDSRHPRIRVVSVDVDSHRVTYARGGLWIDLRPFHQALLP